MPSAAASKASQPPACREIDELLAAASNFVPRGRADTVSLKWARIDPNMTLEKVAAAAAASDAVMLSEDLVLSQPSLTGATAFDRLSRNSPQAPPQERQIIAALCRARFRLLRLEGAGQGMAVTVRDVVSEEVLVVDGFDIPPLAAGTVLFSRVAVLAAGIGRWAGPITPLDAVAVAVARSHPAAGMGGAGANARWAEAVYAQVVRRGTLDIPGLNRPAFLPTEAEHGGSDAECQTLVDLSMAWLALGADAPDSRLLQRTRQVADLDHILNALSAATLASDRGRHDLAAAWERLLLVQLDTAWRRERIGAGAVTLDEIARALNASMRQGVSPRMLTLFERLRAKVSGGRMAEDPALERLVQRIQALRAKTVAQGCTEQEALAAAEKVAELLDRYGLSLGELEFKAQPCEGIGVDTNRRRIGPIDACVPAIAEFFDCRVWAERAENQPIRYIFFGLRGDIAGAHYLYEMVDRAFATETEFFRAGAIYQEMAGERRSATNSFQVGLGRGISEKLRAMRLARDAVMRSASGRDLVPVKAALVDEELSKLGLHFSARASSRGKRILADAFAAGEAAGQRFEFAPAITQAA